MSRMNAIRNMVKAGALSPAGMGALGGAALGGISAGATGGNIGTGMMGGALTGGATAGGISGGQALGKRAYGRAAAGYREGAGSLKNIMSTQTNRKGLLANRGRSLAKAKRLEARQSRFNTSAGGFRGMAAGGLGGMGFATLGSNQNLTFAQSSLSDRRAYREDVRKTDMKYNLQESLIKKQIWQANR